MESTVSRKFPDAKAVFQSFAQMDQEARTIGYGERFPECDTPGLVTKDNNDATGIHHENRAAECGYDLTRFGVGRTGVNRFLSVLNAVGLNPCDDYIRVYRDLGRDTDQDYPDQFLNVWVDEDVMVACTNNPVTGDGCSVHHKGKKGKAGYIGVGGKQDLVEKAVAQIDAVAQTKGKNEGGLFY